MRIFSVTTVVIVVAYLSLYLLQMANFADDPGVGWHLKTGEFVWNSSTVPRADPFLASERGTWIADQWLSDLLLFAGYRTGGWGILYVTLAGIWLVTFFGILFRSVRTEAGSVLASVVAVLLAFKCAQVHFILRPVVFSIFCFACVFVTARGLSRRECVSARSLVLPGGFLIALFALWSNLHPAFVLGLVVVLAVPFARILDGKSARAELVSLAVLALLCVLATCLNPYGTELHESIIALGRSSYLLSLNSEWLPPRLSSFEGATLVTFVILPVLAFLVSSPFRRDVGWFDILSTGFLAFEAFGSVRFLPFAAIAGAFPLAIALRSLAEAGGGISVLRLTRRCVQRMEQHERFSSKGEITAYCCAVAGIAFYGFMPLPEKLGPQESRYPRAIVDVLRSDSSEGVILASPDWGGFITANLHPAFKAVIDDRNTLVGEDLYRQYFQSLDSLEDLSALVNRFHVTHLIIPRKSLVGEALASGRRWAILLDDGKSLVVRIVR
jgi:hypothetical protein